MAKAGIKDIIELCTALQETNFSLNRPANLIPAVNLNIIPSCTWCGDKKCRNRLPLPGK